MCKDDIPRLDIRSAADRLAAAHDVPELSAGLLDREPTRDHGKYLKTTPGHSYGLYQCPACYGPSDGPGQCRGCLGPFVRQPDHPGRRRLSEGPGDTLDPGRLYSWFRENVIDL